MKHPCGLRASVLLFALVAPVAAQEREYGTLFVVRHDPGSITLDARMLRGLLGPSLLRRAQAAALPQLEADEPCIKVGNDSIGKAGPAQPAGVFVGLLRVSLAEMVPKSAEERIIEALLSELRGELVQRLSKGPERRWLAEMDLVNRARRDAEKQLRELYRAGHDLDGRALSRAEEEQHRLRVELAETELEEQTEEPLLKLTQEMLSRAKQGLSTSAARRAEVVLELGGLEAALETGAARQRDVIKLRAQIESLQARAANLAGDVERAAARVGKLASEIDEATLRLNRVQLRRYALVKRLEAAGAAVDRQRERAPKEREGARQVLRLEGEVTRLQRMLEDLQTRQRSVPAVVVQRW